MRSFKLFLFSALLVMAIAIHGQESPRAKYVFLFIGDGMGLSQITMAQAYLSALDGEVGMEPLYFTEFPVTGLAQTYSNDKLITCSAAAGTALATGRKTNNGMLSMSPDKSEIYPTIAEKAKRQGMRVGIVTSVSVDHATPAAFYAHQPDREMYFDIGYQLVTSNFDYFAGGGFREPVKTVNGKKTDLLEVAASNDFFVLNDIQDFKELMRTRKKTLMLSPRTGYGAALPFAIDMGGGDVKLSDLTAKGIDLLEGPEGFFMMVEGGKMDWACHYYDARTSIDEVLALNDAIAAAVAFYQNYPDETIIIVTADHETGGASLGYRETTTESNLAILQHQKSSYERLIHSLRTLNEKKTGKEENDFKKLLELLNTHLGLNDPQNGTLLTDQEKETLRTKMAETIYAKDAKEKEYTTSDQLAVLAMQILSNKAGLAWGTGSHTFVTVPVFAIGVGAEEFTGLMDNTEIPGKLEKLMGIE